MQAIKAVEAVRENFVFIHVGMSCLAANKLPVNINHSIVLISSHELSKESVI
jgi:hypothetical protein